MSLSTRVKLTIAVLLLVAVPGTPSGNHLGKKGIRIWGISSAGSTDHTAPVLGTLDPAGSGSLGGASYTVRAQATDDVAVADVCFYYVYCGTVGCEAPFLDATLIGCDTTEAAGWYTQLWTFPSCGEAPGSRFNLWFRARDAAGNQDTAEQDDQILTGRGC